jgi:hypothetical protein
VIVETSALVKIVTAEPGDERLLRAVAEADDPVLPASCLLEAHMVIRGPFPPKMVVTLERVVAETGLRIAAFTEAHAAPPRRLRPLRRRAESGGAELRRLHGLGGGEGGGAGAHVHRRGLRTDGRGTVGRMRWVDHPAYAC